MSEPSIRCAGVTVTMEGRTILSDLCFDIGPGETVAVVGANGSGKTTLLRACAGLLPMATGELGIVGRDPRASAPAYLADLRAYAPQHPQSAWDYTVSELAALTPAPDRFVAWCQRLCLQEKLGARLSTLSGGERKAAHLCVTFAALGDPFGKALLLDEPTAALDLCRAELVAQAIRASAGNGAAALVATHDLAWARSCDRVLVLQEGRLVADGGPGQVLTDEVVRRTWGGATP